MQIEKTTPTRYKMTLQAYELATLISAVRWISEGAEGTLSPEIVDNMKQFLKNYETAVKHLQQPQTDSKGSPRAL